MAMNRGNMPKQMLPPPGTKRASGAPKNMGGKLPAKVNSPKTNHGAQKLFAKGGMAKKGC